jgi:hypothetical protein
MARVADSAAPFPDPFARARPRGGPPTNDRFASKAPKATGTSGPGMSGSPQKRTKSKPIALRNAANWADRYCWLSIDMHWADRAGVLGRAHHARAYRMQSRPRLIRPKRPHAPKLALIGARRESTELSTESTLFLIGCGWRPDARLPPAVLFASGRTREARGS